MNWRDPNFWDQISQWMVILSLLFPLMVARKNKWAFVVGLLIQPFWFFTSYLHGQWGIFILTFFYSCTYVYGIYQWFFKTTQAQVAS